MTVDAVDCSAVQSPAVTEARASDRFGTNYAGSPEPIYGAHYLPRKFKIAVTVPGDNSVDVLTNDIGIVVITDDAGELAGVASLPVLEAGVCIIGSLLRRHWHSDSHMAWGLDGRTVLSRGTGVLSC